MPRDAPVTMAAFIREVVICCFPSLECWQPLRCLLRKKRADIGDFSRAEPKIGGTGDISYLVGPTCANDGASYGRVLQHPGDGHLAGRAAVTLADGAQ